MNLRDLNQEQLIEESLINLAYGVLVEHKKPLAFKEIITAIENLNARTPEEIKSNLNQFYTDVNIDGRFLILSENIWGLREWYGIDQVEEEIAPTVKVRKKKGFYYICWGIKTIHVVTFRKNECFPPTSAALFLSTLGGKKGLLHTCFSAGVLVISFNIDLCEKWRKKAQFHQFLYT
ncbi:DNA-directed RNA polymerase subunit delta [Kurthia zopfii]|uniref:DNA-directed RNA polymerase subunit delta n=1 Tax=Kurthia zopfii TaxID=1650 RepID=UPI000F6B6A88|nr:RNAP delta factor [Kurthia zopfii]